ncbi:hypothetical protein L210DRAFT_3556982 [Boletus edulis BED1]|uniref:C2H2-type domain-containing protein n=1 Tax=Boletus edulis BED1 TaxID=1328754 RepID=A0AAD4GB70_BOLED|nr:hypothetical protein L210DRAFT_3556982 [Boletus edulis BED1]
MADIDRMFRSELAVLAEQQSQSDSWAFDSPTLDTSNWDTSLEIPPPPSDPTLGLFPTDRADPFTAHLSDITEMPTPLPMPMSMPVPLRVHPPPIQIPLSASSSSGPLTLSPTDSLVQTDPSSEDMDSDDFDLAYPSDSEYLPSPTGINPASLSAPSSATTESDPNMDILGDATAIRPSRRAPRAMTKVPVPIPNLTKKSRGRKVPTSNGEPVYAASRDRTKRGARTYTCHAEGCGKCFVRGEHLKRHIRSIHTDEKRGCDFERRLAGSPFSSSSLKHGRAPTRIAIVHLAGGTI